MINRPSLLSRVALSVLVVTLVGSLGSCKKTARDMTYDSRNLIESRESPYNNIYVYKTGKNISMTFGLNQNIYTESMYNPLDDRDLPVPYTRSMTAALMYPEKIDSILEIGCGGGRIAWYLHRYLPDAKVTTVELDPAVTELAQKYFGIKEEPNFHVVTRDGRLFLADSKDKFDVILIDAYRGPFVPFHLLTQEFYRLVQDHLQPGGVIAQNIEPSTMLYDSAVKTVYSVFPQVEFYEGTGVGDSALQGQSVGGNVVLVAFNGSPRDSSSLSQSAERRQQLYSFRYDLTQMHHDRFQLRPVVVDQQNYLDVFNESGKATGGIDEKAKVLTDDFAPVESLKAIARHNQKWIHE